MKALVIDDEPDLRKIIAEALRRSGFEVVTAGNAGEAIGHFLAGGVDIITLDHRMPGMSGPSYTSSSAVSSARESARRVSFRTSSLRS